MSSKRHRARPLCMGNFKPVCKKTLMLKDSFCQPCNPCWWPCSTSSKFHPLNSSHTLKPLLENLGLYYKALPQLHSLYVNLQEGKSPERDRREAKKNVCFKKPLSVRRSRTLALDFTPLSTAQQAAWPISSPAATKGDDRWPKNTLVVRNREALFCSWWPRMR